MTSYFHINPILNPVLVDNNKNTDIQNNKPISHRRVELLLLLNLIITIAGAFYGWWGADKISIDGVVVASLFFLSGSFFIMVFPKTGVFLAPILAFGMGFLLAYAVGTVVNWSANQDGLYALFGVFLSISVFVSILGMSIYIIIKRLGFELFTSDMKMIFITTLITLALGFVIIVALKNLLPKSFIKIPFEAWSVEYFLIGGVVAFIISVNSYLNNKLIKRHVTHNVSQKMEWFLAFGMLSSIFFAFFEFFNWIYYSFKHKKTTSV